MKELGLKAKIAAIAVPAVAAVIATAIVLVSVLHPPTSTDFSSGRISAFESQAVSAPETVVSSEEAVTSSEDATVSGEQEIVSSNETTVSSEPQPTTPLQTTPTDLTSVTPLKSRHEVPADSESFDITLSFAGDMILATNKDTFYSGALRDYAATHDPGYFLEKVRPIFEADDFTIANVENVFSDRQLEPVFKDYSPAFWFLAPTSNINILSGSSVEGAMIANNHIRDYGEAGYQDSIAAITNSGMIYGDASRIMYFEKGGYVIAVICSGMWGEYQANNIISLMKTAQEHSHYQVVLFHGGTEKIHAPEEWKRRAARKLVDNGADLVVGGHPHVLQPREIYNGVEIVYSIGNFCYGGHRYPENRTVIYQMTLTVGKDMTLEASNSNIIPCYVYTGSINNFQPAVVDDETLKNRILDFMDGKIESPV